MLMLPSDRKHGRKFNNVVTVRCQYIAGDGTRPFYSKTGEFKGGNYHDNCNIFYFVLLVLDSC